MIMRLLTCFRRWLRRRAIEVALDEELALHLEMKIQANTERGMTPTEARRVALCAMGGVTQTRGAVREVRATIFETVARDFQFAARRLARSPSFAVTVIVTLGLGIGANAAMFGVVDAVLIRRLPYSDADRIVRVRGASEQSFIRWGGPEGFTVAPDALRKCPAFAAVGAAVSGGLNLGLDNAERVRAGAVTAGFFDALGARPALGRVFSAQDRFGTPDVAVISDRLWRVRMGADRAVVGKEVILNGRPFTVTGVMPPRVSYPADTDVWVPSGSRREFTGSVPTGVVLARLTPGVTAERAREAVNQILLADLQKVSDLAPRGTPRGVPRGAGSRARRPREVAMISLRDELVGAVRPIVVLTAVAASLVLLVACINVAHLLLARLSTRQREFTVCRALGASRGQIGRQLLVECLLLSTAAGLAAIVAAAWTLPLIKTLLPPVLYDTVDLAVNARVAVATAGFSLCTVLLFGFGPAVSLPRRHLDLVPGRSRASSDRSAALLRSALVVTEIAAAFLLLVGAATVLRTVSGLLKVDIGVRANNTVAFDLMLPEAMYPREGILPTFARLTSDLRDIPGIAAVGATTQIPGDPDPLIGMDQVAMDGHFIGTDRPSRFAFSIAATPGYFAAAGIERVAGRDFTDEDREDAPCVVILSEQVTKVAGVSPAMILGRRVDHGDAPYQRGCVVVGVVKDVLLDGPERTSLGRQYTSEIGRRAALYVPYAQSGYHDRDRHFVVRAHVAPELLLPAIRRTVARINPALPLYKVRTFADIRAALLADRRFAMIVMLAFGLLTSWLAAVGLYSVMAHFVQQRTREIGIRLSIGATPESVRRLVLTRGIGHATAGLMLGAVSTVVAWRIVRAMTPKVGELNAMTIVALGVALLIVTVVTTWVPAWRATRVDPVMVLRAE